MRGASKNVLLFILTAVSVFYAGAESAKGGAQFPLSHEAWVSGVQYAGALLSILLAHEFGHYFAARIHGVDASLPYFIPLPGLSPFGTMGAIIQIRERIKRRRALLDIGAAGPLAGLLLAIPLYAWGAAHSTIVPMADPTNGTLLGEPLLQKLLDHLFAPMAPEGFDLLLSPVAYAAWTGFFVSMLNLIPAAQLDGGHVAYALFGERQNRYARWVHRSMLIFFLVSVGSATVRDLQAGIGFFHVGVHVRGTLLWLVWFELLGILGSFSASDKDAEEAPLSPRIRTISTIVLVVSAWIIDSYGTPVAWAGWFGGLALLIAMEARGGALRDTELVSHPPADNEPLGVVRTIVAIVTLVFFGLLFMPEPFVF